jgi:hypothetical protein
VIDRAGSKSMKRLTSVRDPHDAVRAAHVQQQRVVRIGAGPTSCRPIAWALVFLP